MVTKLYIKALFRLFAPMERQKHNQRKQFSLSATKATNNTFDYYIIDATRLSRKIERVFFAVSYRQEKPNAQQGKQPQSATRPPLKIPLIIIL